MLLNGTELSIAGLVARARGLHSAFEGLRPEVVDTGLSSPVRGWRASLPGEHLWQVTGRLIF